MAETLTKGQKAKNREILDKRLGEGQKVTLKEKLDADYPLTWQEKLEAGLPLTELEEVKADADWNHNKRARDEQEKKAFEELKNRGRLGQNAPAAEEAEEDLDFDEEDDDSNDKKGK